MIVRDEALLDNVSRYEGHQGNEKMRESGTLNVMRGIDDKCIKIRWFNKLTYAILGCRAFSSILAEGMIHLGSMFVFS